MTSRRKRLRIDCWWNPNDRCQTWTLLTHEHFRAPTKWCIYGFCGWQAFRTTLENCVSHDLGEKKLSSESLCCVGTSKYVIYYKAASCWLIVGLHCFETCLCKSWKNHIHCLWDCNSILLCCFKQKTIKWHWGNAFRHHLMEGRKYSAKYVATSPLALTTVPNFPSLTIPFPFCSALSGVASILGWTSLGFTRLRFWAVSNIGSRAGTGQDRRSMRGQGWGRALAGDIWRGEPAAGRGSCRRREGRGRRRRGLPNKLTNLKSCPPLWKARVCFVYLCCVLFLA